VKQIKDTGTNQNNFSLNFEAMIVAVFITVDLYEKRLLEDEIMGLQSNFETP
jgi:hypothetical protein